jgi:anti-anti-sigma factor
MRPETRRRIEVERQGETLILTPREDLREREHREIEAEENELLRLAGDSAVKSVVVDCGRTDSFGLTALGLFSRLWQRVRACGGRMAFCNVSAREAEILEGVRLIHFWSVYPSREEALAAMAAPSGQPRERTVANAEFEVQKAGLAGTIWKTVCRGPEAKARDVFLRQLRLYSVGRFRLLAPDGRCVEEARARPLFSDDREPMLTGARQ